MEITWRNTHTNVTRTRGRRAVGAEEEEEEAHHYDERYEVHRPLPPRRPRRGRLLGLRLHVVVVAAGFLRQELGHRGDAQLPLHYSGIKGTGKEKQLS